MLQNQRLPAESDQTEEAAAASAATRRRILAGCHAHGSAWDRREFAAIWEPSLTNFFHLVT
jgi:hypothetical protein